MGADSTAGGPLTTAHDGPPPTGRNGPRWALTRAPGRHGVPGRGGETSRGLRGRVHGRDGLCTAGGETRWNRMERRAG